MTALAKGFAEDFRANCEASMEIVKRLVEHERTPALAAGVSHQYQDKFLLAEFLTNAAIVALVDTLEGVGVNPGHLIEIAKWAQSRSVTLRFKAEERCKVGA